jgi:transposase
MLYCFVFSGGRMAGEDIIMVRQKELKRLHVIHKVIEGNLTQQEAALFTSLSPRQIRRIVKRIEEEGDAGIRHRSRGKPSNRRLPHGLKDRIIGLYKTIYTGFGPTLFTEKLEEVEGIVLSDETVRRLLIQEGEWTRHRRRKAHRQRRQRKDHYGEMIQIDGSHHDWFEGRGPKCVLMGYIDDATNKVYGRFYGYEGTIPAMDSFKRYIKKYGIPMSIYLDKHTTYKSPAKPIDDEIPLSEFGRAVEELGVDLIHANSPQAKGRVERLFETLQDRLVKEMRLKNICTIDEANRFLIHYLPRYNRKFARKPEKEENLHIDPLGADLDAILCIKTERTIRNDNTISYDGKLYQIKDRTSSKKVVVQERIDTTLRIMLKGVALTFSHIEARPDKPGKEPSPLKLRRTSKPSADHPWRKPLFRKKGCGDIEKAVHLPHPHIAAENEGTSAKVKHQQRSS